MVVTVLYPSAPDATFNHDYYLSKHIPLLYERWGPLGLRCVQVLRGIGQPDGQPAPFTVIAVLTFASLDDFKAAGKAHGREIFADIRNFTNVQPIVQLNEADRP